MDQEETLYRMKILRRSSLIEDWEKNKMLKVTVHDLYIDFAEHQIYLEESQRWCVYKKGGQTLPSCLESDPPSLRWSNLVRLRLQSTSIIRFPDEKLREWANLLVLDINLFQHKSFDIRPLKSLRSLKLKSFVLETLTCCDNMEQLRYVKLSCTSLVRNPNLSSCSNLVELNMRLAHPVFGPGPENPPDSLLSFTANALKILPLVGWMGLPEILDLGNLLNLETVEILGCLYLVMKNVNFIVENLGGLRHLKRLELKNLPIKGSLPGLENLISLEYLVLSKSPELYHLPGLRRLTNLNLLDVSSTAIEELSGVEKLLKLRELNLVNCKYLKTLPNLHSLAKA